MQLRLAVVIVGEAFALQPGVQTPLGWRHMAGRASLDGVSHLRVLRDEVIGSGLWSNDMGA